MLILWSRDLDVWTTTSWTWSPWRPNAWREALGVLLFFSCFCFLFKKTENDHFFFNRLLSYPRLKLIFLLQAILFLLWVCLLKASYLVLFSDQSQIFDQVSKQAQDIFYSAQCAHSSDKYSVITLDCEVRHRGWAAAVFCWGSSQCFLNLMFCVL